MIEFWSHGSPNGHKVSIALEELGLPYRTHGVNVFAGEGQSEDFKRTNPNGKVPTLIVDEYQGMFEGELTSMVHFESS